MRKYIDRESKWPTGLCGRLACGIRYAYGAYVISNFRNVKGRTRTRVEAHLQVDNPIELAIMYSALVALLPSHQGLLPSWLLFISTVSLFNSVQNYTTLSLTRRVYAAQPAQTTPLSARTFGTWTAITSVVRLYAAYHITNPQVYQLALWSYVVALAHFMSEWLIFKTARLGAGLTGPLVVATMSLSWMVSQWEFYIGGA
ncbi:MAG: ergosterol biosynthesis protein [Geoglossum simile]|nr:MAG: ergosterol biosynthesis protein [Geoglossum simile]